MAFFFNETRKYKRRSINQYIEYEHGMCAIICTCGDHGTVLDAGMLDSLGTDVEARLFIRCPVCNKPLLKDLPLTITSEIMDYEYRNEI